VTEFTHTIQALHPSLDLLPTRHFIARAQAVHRATEHYAELMVGKLEDICQPLCHVHFSCAQDSLPVNIVLQLLQRRGVLVDVWHVTER